jgi:hypothetical protein
MGFFVFAVAGTALLCFGAFVFAALNRDDDH